MPPCCWFLVFARVWCLPLVLVAAKEQVETCLGSAKRCGNLTISDPFWLTNRKTGIPCGSSGFEVTCFQNGAPVLRSTVPIGLGLAIVSYKECSLRVVDLGKLELLEASSSCPVLMWNTSVKVRPPLRIDPVNLNLVFYNCTVATAAAAAHRDRKLLQTTLKFGNKSNEFVHVGGHYNTTGIDAMEGCHATIMPVSGKANASNYGQLISNGFLLTWQQQSVSGKLTHQTVFHTIKLIYE